MAARGGDKPAHPNADGGRGTEGCRSHRRQVDIDRRGAAPKSDSHVRTNEHTRCWH